MKKKNRRLALHRETVRILDNAGLQGVVGGTYTRTDSACESSCYCPDYTDTFSADCTADCPTTSLG